MGRESDYEKQKKIDNISKEEIKENYLNLKTIGTVEIAKLFGCDARTISDLLKKFCDQNNFNIVDFKEGKNYQFKAEWNGILTLLLLMQRLPDFDKRFQSQALLEFYDQSKVLLEGIDKYLTPQDQKFVKEDVCYKELQVKSKLVHLLTRQVTAVIVSLGMLPDTLLTETLIYFNEALETIPTQINQKYVHWLMNTKESEKKIEREKGKEFIDNASTKDILISMLKLKMNNQEIPEQTYSPQDINDTMFKTAMIYSNLTFGEERIDKIIEENREEYLEIKDIKNVLEKVENVLDLNNYWENIVLSWIKNILRTVAVTKTLTEENIDLGKELLRQVMANEGLKFLVQNSEKESLKNQKLGDF